MHRIVCSRQTADKLKEFFPTSSYDEAITYLVGRHALAAGDPVNCGNTELWIKLDRLEEVLSLLALANVDLGDIYRRQVSDELGRLGSITAQLADLTTAFDQASGKGNA